MITIDDLKLTIEFWKWLCELTEDYYIFSHHEYIWIENKKTLNRWRITKDDGLNKQNPITLKNTIESIIYQAIDRLGDLFIANRIKNNFYEMIQVADMILIHESNGMRLRNSIIFANYENRITARLAALQWVFNQGVKYDSI